MDSCEVEFRILYRQKLDDPDAIFEGVPKVATPTPTKAAYVATEDGDRQAAERALRREWKDEWGGLQVQAHPMKVRTMSLWHNN